MLCAQAWKPGSQHAGEKRWTGGICLVSTQSDLPERGLCLGSTWPQAPQSLGFSRQEHWSGLPFPPPMHESEKPTPEFLPGKAHGQRSLVGCRLWGCTVYPHNQSLPTLLLCALTYTSDFTVMAARSQASFSFLVALES